MSDIFGPTQSPKCIGCGLVSKKVEASGIWHCPNPRCKASGATWFRSKLKSYKEVSGGSHTVNEYEWKAAAYMYRKCPEIFEQLYGEK